MLRRLILSATLLACIAAGSWLRLRSMNHVVETRRYENLYYLPPLEWLSVFSLGWHRAGADLVWMKALVYYGEEMRERASMSHSFDYADAIVHLDPDFAEAYRWAALSGMYRTTEVTEADLRKSIAFLQRGVERFPNHGKMNWDLGSAWAFELAPRLASSEERIRAKETGAEYLAAAARLGAAPAYAVLSNATMMAAAGRTEQAVAHLREMYAQTQDEEIRDRIVARIQSLQQQTAPDAFLDSAQTFERERIRDFPYLPPTLYYLVGPATKQDLRSVFRNGYQVVQGQQNISFDAYEE